MQRRGKIEMIPSGKKIGRDQKGDENWWVGRGTRTN